MLFHETQIEKYKIIFNCEIQVETTPHEKADCGWLLEWFFMAQGPRKDILRQTG